MVFHPLNKELLLFHLGLPLPLLLSRTHSLPQSLHQRIPDQPSSEVHYPQKTRSAIPRQVHQFYPKDLLLPRKRTSRHFHLVKLKVLLYLPYKSFRHSLLTVPFPEQKRIHNLCYNQNNRVL